MKSVLSPTVKKFYLARNKKNSLGFDPLRFASSALLVSVFLFLYWLALDPFSRPVYAQTPIAPDAEIIFIDDAGFIRVLDPLRIGSSPLVEWVSPTAGWYDFATGDFNNDGDAEIVAIGGDATTGRLAIYDPVVTSGAVDPAQTVNGIPWATLYETTVPGKPTLVGTGNLAVNTAGDELLYVFELNAADKPDPNDRTRVVTLRMTDALDGRTWQPLVEPYDSEQAWTQVSIGPIDDRAGADIALVDAASPTSALDIFRVDTKLVRFYNNESNDLTWQAVALGKFRPGDVNTVAAVRNSDPKRKSLIVLGFDDDKDDNFEDVYGEYFNPAPHRLFFANVNGSADDELFLLRNLASTQTTQPHLFMRNRGSDDARSVEVRLDGDNGYQAGAGGDIDGDGREEVVIIRNNRIRIYPNIESALNFNEVSFNTNARSVAIAELDQSGFSYAPFLAAAPGELNLSLNTGNRQTVNLTLTNGGTSDALAFSIALEGNPTWATVTLASGQTPATIQVNLDAYGLAAGQHTTKLVVTSSSASVSNSPLSIPLTLNVSRAVVASPAAIANVVYPCPGSEATFTVDIRVEEPLRNNFTAQVLSGPVPAAEAVLTADAQLLQMSAETSAPTDFAWSSNVPWITSATSLTTTVPAAVTLTIDPTRRTNSFEQAYLQIIATDQQNPTISRNFPITLLCASYQLHAPIIAR